MSNSNPSQYLYTTSRVTHKALLTCHSNAPRENATVQFHNTTKERHHLPRLSPNLKVLGRFS